MVVVFESKKGEYDFIVQTSVAFAMAKLNFGRSVKDNRVEPFSSTLDLSDETGLALVGHGSPGAIEKWSAAQIGDALADTVRGVSSKLRKLLVTSCYAGVRVNDVAGTSVVEVLAEKLRHRGLGGLEIVGYNGPSIKNAELGFFARVVHDPTPGSNPPSAQLMQAFTLQEKGKNDAALAGNNLVGRTVKTTANLGTLGPQSASASKDFYTQFINALDTAKSQLTLKGDDVARVCTVID